MGEIREIGRRNTNLLDYTTWTVGDSSATGFSINGTTSENIIITASDPFGKNVPIWEASNTDTNSNDDGGWVSSSFGISNQKMYRFSVWVKRPVTGNGHFYFGLYGYGSVNGASSRTGGTTTTNPYFEVNGSWTEWGNNSDWYLVVAHVWPYGSGTGSNHADSGMYTRNNGLFHPIENDFVWLSSTTSSAHRTYLFYSTNTSTVQQWVYPRVDAIDGTEPSIQDLLAGYDSYTFDDRENDIQPFKIYNNYIHVNRISELGPADGLIGYYPFDTDVNDYSGNNNHGTNVGASLSEGIIGNGYDFDGPGGSDYLSIPSGSLAAPYTVSMWLKSDETLSTSTSSLYRRTPLKGDTAWNPGIWLTFGIIRAFAATKYTDVSWSGDTEWHLIGQVYDGTNLWIILDGQLLIGAETAYAPVSISSLIVGNESALGTTYGWNGKIDDFRIYNRALSASEVNILYETTKLQKIKVSSTTLYTNGIIEH